MNVKFYQLDSLPIANEEAKGSFVSCPDGLFYCDGEKMIQLSNKEICDNLISEDNNKPLSANQGRVLNEKIEAIQSSDSTWLSMYAQYFYMEAAPYIGEKNSDFVFNCVPDMHCCFDTMTNYHLQMFNSIDKLNNQCNLFISSGDILFSGNTSVTKQQMIDNYISKYKTMVSTFADNGIAFAVTIGGHDFNFYNRVGYYNNVPENSLSKAEQRTHLIQPCVDAINNKLSNRFQAVIGDDPSVCYYYIVDKKTGHYTILLDETDHPATVDEYGLLKYNTYNTVCYSQAQLTWLKELLLTVPDGKYIALHNHMGIVGTTADIAGTCNELKKILISYINRTEYTGGSGTDNNDVSWTLDSTNFRNCKGMIVGLFKGHTHVQEYTKIDNVLHQFCSVNPDGYPFGSNAYCMTQLFGGDVYVIRNQELRNLHYGKTSLKSGGSGTWIYKKFSNRFLTSPVIIANNVPIPEADEDDDYEIVETLQTVQRSQNGQYYFAIPQNGAILGEVLLRSNVINGIPSSIGQYTLSDGSYTPTGGDYINKNLVTYNEETGILTINDNGTITAKANGYIMIGYYSNDSVAYIVKEKPKSEEGVLDSLKEYGCSKVDDAVAIYPNLGKSAIGETGLKFKVETVQSTSTGGSTTTKGSVLRTGLIPEYTDTIEITFHTLDILNTTSTLFCSRTNGTSGKSFTTFLINGSKLRADYDNPVTTTDTNRYTLIANTYYKYSRCKDGDYLNTTEIKPFINTTTGEYTTTIPLIIGGSIAQETDYSDAAGLSNASNFLNNFIVHTFAVKGNDGNYKMYLVACENNKMIDLVTGNTFTCDERNWGGYYYNTASFVEV